MTWDGQERRKSCALYCEQHQKVFAEQQVIINKLETIDKRINGSIEDIEKHMDGAKGWRLSIIGVASMYLIQAIILANMWGKLVRQVEIDTARLDKMESAEMSSVIIPLNKLIEHHAAVDNRLDKLEAK